MVELAQLGLTNMSAGLENMLLSVTSESDPSEWVQPAMGIANSPAHKKSALLEPTRRRKTISPRRYPLVP